MERRKGENDNANRESQKNCQMEQIEETYLIDRDKLCNLFEKGIIDELGMPIIDKEESNMM